MGIYIGLFILGFIIGILYTKHRLQNKRERVVYRGIHDVYNKNHKSIDKLEIVAECYVLGEIDNKVKLKPIIIQLDDPEYNTEFWIEKCKDKLKNRWVDSSSLTRNKNNRKQKIKNVIKEL